jgi:putative ABC transport system permease protein
MVNMAPWQEVSFGFEPSVQIMLIAVLAGGLMGIVGGFFPALHAARLSPIEAMRR